MTNEKQELGNIYCRVWGVQQDIHTVVKSGFNEHFKYAFARERDIIAEIKPLLGKYRLVVLHTLVKEENVADIAKLTFKFTIVNIDDPKEFIEAEGIGYGKDTQDKGAPKAYTMALKYFLSKQFLVETGDDTEDDKKGKKESPVETFEKAKKMILASRNVDGLIEFSEKLKTSKLYNVAQKKELEKAVSNRVSELDGTNEKTS